MELRSTTTIYTGLRSAVSDLAMPPTVFADTFYWLARCGLESGPKTSPAGFFSSLPMIPPKFH